MKPKSIFGNYVYNLIYKIIECIIPFITVPYVSRVLGVNQIGIFSYTSSIVAYFTLFAGFGISGWGQREIAFSQADSTNIQQRTKVFWEAIILKLILTVIILGGYIFFVLSQSKYQKVYLIQSLAILSVFFDISWFFQGMEDFRRVTLRDLFVKSFGLVLIFIFVHSENDFFFYVGIQALTILLGNILLWIGLHKHLCKINFLCIKPYKHIGTLFSFFILQLAIYMNLNLDKTLLGILGKNEAENGFYEQAGKIITMSKLLQLSLITVLSPRIAKFFSANCKEELKKLIEKSCMWMIRFSGAMAIGIFIISDDFVTIYLGSGYEKVALLLKLYVPVIIYTPLETFLGTMFVQTGRQNINTLGVMASCLTNVILNCVLIPTYFSIGATIATVIAEFIVFCMNLYFAKRDVHIKYLLKKLISYFVPAIIMGIIIFEIGKVAELLSISIIAKVLFQISIGIIFYIFYLIYILKDYELIEEVKRIIWRLQGKNK